MAATLERTRQGFPAFGGPEGWKPMEIGWDLSPEPAEKWLRLREAGDLAGWSKRRHASAGSGVRSLHPAQP